MNMKMTRGLPLWQRKFYVHPIQRKYLFLSMVPLVVCAMLLVFLVFTPLALTFLGSAFDPEKVATLTQIHVLAIRIWPAVLISMLAVSILSIFATHKFAGPLHRLEQVVGKVADGHLPGSIRVRQNDELQEFAAALDRAFGTISSALAGIRQQEALAMKELATLQGKCKAGLSDAREILHGLERLGRFHREVDRIVCGFTLPQQRDQGGVEDSAPLEGEQPPAF